MGACCTHSAVVQPPDAVAGLHRPIVLDRGQRHVGFRDPCTRKFLPVPCAWKYRAEDNPGRRMIGTGTPPAHYRKATAAL